MAWYWILIIVAGALLLPWIIQWSAVAALERREAWSEGFICRSLRYLVYITGQIRSGKSTFLAAHSNIRTKDLRRKALSRIEFTCLAFPGISIFVEYSNNLCHMPFRSFSTAMVFFKNLSALI